MDYITYIRELVGNNKIIMNAAACIIVDEDNKILLQLRADDHTWGLPGGIMELGETYEECVKREVKEETGLHVTLIDDLGPFYNKNKIWPNGDEAFVICNVFVAKVRGGILEKDNEETLDLVYFSFDNLPNIGSSDHEKAIKQYGERRD